MAKTITFTYRDKDYTLEFTRASVAAMERKGFNVEDITTKPANVLPQLFRGAFIAHHPYVREETVNEIFSRMPQRMELIVKLAEMYNEPISTMMDEPEENVENPTWNANW